MEERAHFISLAVKNTDPVEFTRAFVPLALASSLNGDVLKTLFQLGISYHQRIELPDTSKLDWGEVVIKCLESLRSRAGAPPTAMSEYPRARKWVSNSADLRAKVLDPPITSVRSALKSSSRLPSQPRRGLCPCRRLRRSLCPCRCPRRSLCPLLDSALLCPRLQSAPRNLCYLSAL